MSDTPEPLDAVLRGHLDSVAEKKGYALLNSTLRVRHSGPLPRNNGLHLVHLSTPHTRCIVYSAHDDLVLEHGAGELGGAGAKFASVALAACEVAAPLLPSIGFRVLLRCVGERCVAGELGDSNGLWVRSTATSPG